MKTDVNPFLVWTPRLLTIAFAGFVGLFAIDAFTEEGNTMDVMRVFLIHLTPSLIIVLILVFSWNREWIGGLTFIVLAITYAFYAQSHFWWILLISIPLFIIGILFSIVWFQKKGIQ